MMLLFAKIQYLMLTICVAMICIADAVNAQAPGRQNHTLLNSPSKNDVSITISVSRPSLSEANKEAQAIQATMPEALFKIFHKDVKIKYAPVKVTTKKKDEYGSYQVTVAGSGKS